MNLNNTTAVGHCHFELVTINVDSLSARGQMTKGLHDQPADGIYFFVAKMGTESVVEVFNRRQSANGPVWRLS